MNVMALNLELEAQHCTMPLICLGVTLTFVCACGTRRICPFDYTGETDQFTLCKWQITS